MRIVCPSCAATYEVPTSRLSSRRMVRCARCGGEWAAIRDAEAPPPVSDRTPEDRTEHPEEHVASLPPVTAMDRLAAPLPPAPRSTRLTVAWALTFLILIAAMAATVTWRSSLVRVWPPSSRILGSAD